MTEQADLHCRGLCGGQVARLVAAGIPEETAWVACHRALGNARAACRGLPDHLQDEVLVAKLRYELTLTEAWSRRLLDSITQ